MTIEKAGLINMIITVLKCALWVSSISVFELPVLPLPFQKTTYGAYGSFLNEMFAVTYARSPNDLCCIPPSLQSGFRPGHSTETAAVLRVLSDILQAVDSEDVAALVLF